MVDCFIPFLVLDILSFLLGFGIGKMTEISTMMDIIKKIDYLPYPEFKKEIEKIYG